MTMTIMFSRHNTASPQANTIQLTIFSLSLELGKFRNGSCPRLRFSSAL